MRLKLQCANPQGPVRVWALVPSVGPGLGLHVSHHLPGRTAQDQLNPVPRFRPVVPVLRAP